MCNIIFIYNSRKWRNWTWQFVDEIWLPHSQVQIFTKIQRVQNTLAKIVLNNSVLPSAIALRQLHWLPVKQRIHVKIATLTYRTLQSGSLSYLSLLINFNNPSRPLLSSSLNPLHVPFTAKAMGSKAFRFAAPTAWNSIPQNISLLPSTVSFKRSLKTHLFSLPG